MSETDVMDTDFVFVEGDESLQLIDGIQWDTTNSSIQEVSPSTSKKEVVGQTKILRFPLSRVKQIMKMDPDCALISADALFLITKATEMFLEYLAEETGKQMGKRKTVMKRDVDVVIETVPELCFLDGALE